MSDLQNNQIDEWLKKLERESWQLELLVSAFTIFLLIQAIDSFSGFFDGLPYQYDMGNNMLTFVYVFLGMLGVSLRALSIFLVIHLMLRGFWIGTIGLRSVQSKIEFSKLRYSEFFNKKLKKKIISLDNMVIMLDEMCSVIFSFSFLVISVLIAFGLYVLFVGAVSLTFTYFDGITNGWVNDVVGYITLFTVLSILFSGVIYMLDYFSLGFFKKYNRLSRMYYPIYHFYSWITASVISRSIYYYMISKFSKKRIRLIYLFFALLLVVTSITEYDHFQFYSDIDDNFVMRNNYYDDLRSETEHIEKVSIPSRICSGSVLPLFLRYNPEDNDEIQGHCPDFEPLKKNGVNMTVIFSIRSNGLSIDGQNYENEDMEKLIDCHASLYKIFINDSLYDENKFFFYNHPSKEQNGLLTMLPTDGFEKGENRLVVKQALVNSSGEERLKDYASMSFWFE